jgi:hypothetical protein
MFISALTTEILEDLLGAYLMENDPAGYDLTSKINFTRYGCDQEDDCLWHNEGDGFVRTRLCLRFDRTVLRLDVTVHTALCCQPLCLIGKRLAAMHPALGNELVAVAEELMNPMVTITFQLDSEARSAFISSADEWVAFATRTLEPLIDAERDGLQSMSWEDDASGSDTDVDWMQFLATDE